MTSTRGVASAVFTEDLDEGSDMADSPFGRERAAALCERLGEPGRLVSLTLLGTRAMRQRMLALGREAGLVGELAGASPAGLLGTVAEHYTPDTTAREIAIWPAGHGGSLDPLVQAVRDCPFVSRRVALLQTLQGCPGGRRATGEPAGRPGTRAGRPARETIEDFRTLVAEPILTAPSGPRTVRVDSRRRPRPGKRRRR